MKNNKYILISLLTIFLLSGMQSLEGATAPALQNTEQTKSRIQLKEDRKATIKLKKQEKKFRKIQERITKFLAKRVVKKQKTQPNHQLYDEDTAIVLLVILALAILVSPIVFFAAVMPIDVLILFGVLFYIFLGIGIFVSLKAIFG